MFDKNLEPSFEPIESEEVLAQISGGNFAPSNTATITDSCNEDVCDTSWDNGHL